MHLPKMTENWDLRPSQSLGLGRSNLAPISNRGDDSIEPIAGAFASVLNQIFSHLGYRISIRCLSICLLLFCFSIDCHSSHSKNRIPNAPNWMKRQIKEDLLCYKNRKISLKKMDKLFQNHANDWLLVKFSIEGGNVDLTTNIAKDHFLYHRVISYYNVLVMLAERFYLPDIQFLISMADGVELSDRVLEDVPIFGMCKSVGQKCILIPDFDILNQGYQVLDNLDIERLDLPWENKIPSLIWRGSTAQNGLLISNDNVHQFSRVKLCELSLQHPHLIDAKFTIFAQLGESIPYLQQFESGMMSFESQLNYKYHILIDGNASSYSASGWKFFANSTIFKPHSRWIQWYYSGLHPWVHYIPVTEDLSDLVEKIHWTIHHDSLAKEIAHHSRKFALSHLTHPNNLLYLRLALLKYSKLKFKHTD